jgi:hypothetical protein
MLTKVLALNGKALNVALARNISSSSVLSAKSDPVQQLFVDKIREYYKKKR